MLLKIFHEIEREGMLPNSLQEGNIILTPKLDDSTTNSRNINKFPR
jgi:hypothetical protein